MREYLGTSDADVRTLIGKRDPNEIADALVNGTKLTNAKLRAQLAETGMVGAI